MLCQQMNAETQVTLSEIDRLDTPEQLEYIGCDREGKKYAAIPWPYLDMNQRFLCQPSAIVQYLSLVWPILYFNIPRLIHVPVDHYAT